jgi:hypothetical protein
MAEISIPGGVCASAVVKPIQKMESEYQDSWISLTPPSFILTRLSQFLLEEHFGRLIRLTGHIVCFPDLSSVYERSWHRPLHQCQIRGRTPVGRKKETDIWDQIALLS